jgi:hypothetical protein
MPQPAPPQEKGNGHMSTIHDQIRTLVAKAEAKALKNYAKKIDAETERHEKRREELMAECELAVKVARAALPDAPPLQSEPEPEAQAGELLHVDVDLDTASTVAPAIPAAFLEPPPELPRGAIREIDAEPKTKAGRRG